MLETLVQTLYIRTATAGGKNMLSRSASFSQ
jgi:hypothetical protein